MEKIKNSIDGLEHGNTLVQKLLYTLLLVLGILFFVASLSTVYSMYSLFQSTDSLADLNTRKLLLFILYIVLNFIVGYGLVFCKKWVVPLFGFNALLMGGASLYSQFIVPNQMMASTTTAAFFITFVLFAITFLLRKLLNDSLYKKWIDISYIILLLITFVVTYLI